jgi:hypothetical protein
MAFAADLEAPSKRSRLANIPRVSLEVAQSYQSAAVTRTLCK